MNICESVVLADNNNINVTYSTSFSQQNLCNPKNFPPTLPGKCTAT